MFINKIVSIFFFALSYTCMSYLDLDCTLFIAIRLQFHFRSTCMKVWVNVYICDIRKKKLSGFGHTICMFIEFAIFLVVSVFAQANLDSKSYNVKSSPDLVIYSHNIYILLQILCAIFFPLFPFFCSAGARHFFSVCCFLLKTIYYTHCFFLCRRNKTCIVILMGLVSVIYINKAMHGFRCCCCCLSNIFCHHWNGYLICVLCDTKICSVIDWS